MTVPLLDLTPQYEGMKAELDAAVSRVVASQRFILGPEVAALEDEVAQLLGVPQTVGCASGTDALLLILKAIGAEDEDEAIVPAFTFFATAGAVWNAGFRPVFCDIDPVTFNVTPEAVEAVWSERTRVVVPVHLFGQMAPMAELHALASQRGALLIEDAAQAILASQRLPLEPTAGGAKGATPSIKAGASGDAGAFSFFPTKNLGGFGDAGLISTSDEELAARLRRLRVHGAEESYHHEHVGTNSRLDAIQAAVLRAKLPYLEKWTLARQENASRYDRLLSDVAELRIPVSAEGNVHVYNQYTVRAERRDELRAYLEGRGIGTGVYYPRPLHLQDCFASLGGQEGQLPEAELACREVLSLPVFAELGEERLERVVCAIREFYEDGAHG